MQKSFGKTRFALVFFFVILAVNFMVAQKPLNGGQNLEPTGFDHDVRPVAPGGAAAPTPFAVTTGNGINYNGGPVLHGTVPIYVIWYGNWNGTGSNTQATVNLVGTFLNSLGGSALELVNTTYGDTTANVSGNLNLARQTFRTGSQGTRPTNNKLSETHTRARPKL